jgi:hypothetical protein
VTSVDAIEYETPALVATVTIVVVGQAPQPGVPQTPLHPAAPPPPPVDSDELLGALEEELVATPVLDASTHVSVTGSQLKPSLQGQGLPVSSRVTSEQAPSATSTSELAKTFFTAASLP